MANLVSGVWEEEERGEEEEEAEEEEEGEREGKGKREREKRESKREQLATILQDFAAQGYSIRWKVINARA